MRHFRLVKWMSIILSITIGGMGISYSAYTDNISIDNIIQTGSMNYVYETGSDILRIELDPDSSNKLLHLLEGEKYIIPYSLKKTEQGNVRMGKINNKLIGDIEITLDDMYVIKEGEHIPLIMDEPIGVPDSLGTFECYHDYDGEKGSITLIKKSQYKAPELTIYKEDLPGLLQEQLEINVPSSIEDEVTGDEFEYKEAIEEIATFMVWGNYSFEIELNYSQYNE